MKLNLANKIRSHYTETLLSQFTQAGEDCGMIASNSFNFPIVVEGEEGWVEITIKVTKDGGDDGYAKRDEYCMKCDAREAKAKERAEAKAKKIERDKKAREERKRAKEDKDVLGTTFCTYCGSNERKVYNYEPEEVGLADTDKYYKTYCPNCGKESSILKQSYNEKSKQKGE